MDDNSTPVIERTADRTTRMLRDLERYWQELSRSSVIPFRSDVDPRRIDAALPYAFVLQRVARGVARFRVAGAEIENLLGMDPRGMPLTTLFSPNGRNAIQHWLTEVFDRPAIVEIPLVSSWGIGRPKLDGKLLILPLAAEDGTVTMAMGALIVEGTTGRAPRRFEVPDGDIRVETVVSEPTARTRIGREHRPIDLDALAPVGNDSFSGEPQLDRIVPKADDLPPVPPAPHVTARAQRRHRDPGTPYLRLVVDNG